MHIQPHGYSGIDDQREMIQLARSLRGQTLHVIDLPYRLSSWAVDDLENICLWRGEDGQLVAWAVMQPPFWTIDYVYKPDISVNLHQQILTWADQRAQKSINTTCGHPAWYMNVFADQIERRQILEQNGFIDQAEMGKDAWSKVWMELTKRVDVPVYPLPTGFSMRPLAGEIEVEAYVELHQAVFETRNMTTDWRFRTLKHPDYVPDLDLVVVAPDGHLAAFCIGWLSQSPGEEAVGQIEPLGCHADFRSYALGRVVLCETLRRLQQHAAKLIFVETDNYRNTAFRLYESVGFQVFRDVRVYGKDYNVTAG